MEEPEYIVTADGRREMSEESQRKRTFSYLEDLWPTEWVGTPELQKKMSSQIYKGINGDLSKPTLILLNLDVPKAVFASVLNACCLLTNKMPKWQQTSVSHGTHQFLCGDLHDIADEFDGTPILLVSMSAEIKNILHPQIVRSYAIRRKERGLLTFFFLQGTLGTLRTKKWTLSDDYDESGNPVDNFYLDKYLRIIDLNKVFKVNTKENKKNKEVSE